jgi:hypothetical protein
MDLPITSTAASALLGAGRRSNREDEQRHRHYDERRET